MKNELVRRVGVVIASLLVLALGSPGIAGAARRVPKAQKPCTLLAISQIEAQFGGPVTRLGVDPIGKDTCAYEVAPNSTSPQGGKLLTISFWPNPVTGTGGASDAVAAVTSQRDFEQGVDLPGLGAAAYLNDFNRALFVAKNAKRAYGVQWADNDITDFGLPAPPLVIDRLRALASDMIAPRR